MGYLGLPVADGEVEAPGEPLTVTATGQQWFGPELSTRLGRLSSPVNRGLPRTRPDPGHWALVSGAGADFIGAYRFNGWGGLWRIGGFNPNPEVVLPAMVAVAEHLATQPPEPVQPGGIAYLWHATVIP